MMERPLAELRDDARRGSGSRAGPRRTLVEDHLSALLETMRILSPGQGDRAPAPIAEQRAFFERHIAPWAFDCCAAISNCPLANYYRRSHNSPVASWRSNVTRSPSNEYINVTTVILWRSACALARVAIARSRPPAAASSPSHRSQAPPLPARARRGRRGRRRGRRALPLPPPRAERGDRRSRRARRRLPRDRARPRLLPHRQALGGGRIMLLTKQERQASPQPVRVFAASREHASRRWTGGRFCKRSGLVAGAGRVREPAAATARSARPRPPRKATAAARPRSSAPSARTARSAARSTPSSRTACGRGRSRCSIRRSTSARTAPRAPRCASTATASTG